jgi:hypothetical protein
MSCNDCGTATLNDGVCSDCYHNYARNYPYLLEQNKQFKEIVTRLKKYHSTLLRNQEAIKRSPGGIDKMVRRTTVLKQIEEILGESQK